MSDVQFDESDHLSYAFPRRTAVFAQYSKITPNIIRQRHISGAIKLIMKLGITKDEKAAGIVLLVLAVAGILTSVLVIWYYMTGGGFSGVIYNLPESILDKLPKEIQEKIRAAH